ncbi:TPA: 50S ribosomal protein L28 [Candidatus Peregrinibacteria bacterium]|nr:50S ribosomal protein L28 [Candidatus Peregrinibacteria bacterium]
MSNICEKCGKRPRVGHNVSYSQRKTKRRFMPNLVIKRIWMAAKKSFIRCKVCTSCLRTMMKKM